MKKFLLALVILMVLSVPVLASEVVDDWSVGFFIQEMEADRASWNKATVLAFIREMIAHDFITEEDIQKELSSITTGVSVVPTEKYASLEILPDYGYYLTGADGHIYSIYMEFDDMEEVYLYYLKEDGKAVYQFDEDWGPRGVVQINGTIYVATIGAVYRYSSGKMTLVTDKITGYIHRMITNGRDIYIVCDDDNPDWDGAYLEGTYYKVTTSGTVTKLKGVTVPVDYQYCGFSVSSDGSWLARVPFNDDGTKVLNLVTGKEYFQRDDEESESHAYDEVFTPNGEYSVGEVLYYGNCLLVNVKGSLVYYDDKNKPHVILGNMKGSRLWRESYVDTPAHLWPIKTGLGDKVGLGYVLTWTVGDDGCIYGITKQRWDKYYTFKLKIPDTVKKVVTYRKTK